MRAYTSLTGHIFGSHDEIEGYYEMHKGYFSWKSLVHAKLLYYANHKVKKSAKYLFDKILHNEHYIAPKLLKRNDIETIMSLRSPEKTIPSIVLHFKNVNPEHEYNNIDNATQYYIARVTELAKLSLEIEGSYLYFDAEAIKDNTSKLLEVISEYLNLESPLTPKYKKMKKTGKRFSGDSSKELLSGEIQKSEKSIAAGIHIPEALLSQAQESYNASRNILINNAKTTFTLGNTDD
jgi:hypothetical protein